MRTIANVFLLLGLLALAAGSLPHTAAAAGGADKLAAKQVKAGTRRLQPEIWARRALPLIGPWS